MAVGNMAPRRPCHAHELVGEGKSPYEPEWQEWGNVRKNETGYPLMPFIVLLVIALLVIALLAIHD
ncbi:hypothetical protein RAA17_13010 [Komagataeibacter rhaeticus]|nr:hypothetical protein [Komagataeibacter rhaeticus]